MSSRPFRDADNTPDPIHRAPHGAISQRRHADGIYIRDPECLLFKEWARADREHSPLHKGFLFTAVAYSDGRPHSDGNRTDYFFALDPERAGDAHLYPLWAALQARELEVTGRTSLPADSVAARRDFAGRCVDADPWYDGNAFRATLVATPHAGTALRGGTASDLTDDAVAQLVRDELENSFYLAPLADVEDYAVDVDGLRTVVAQQVLLAEGVDFPLTPNAYRLAFVTLCDDVDLTCGALAQQIGERLWPLLQPAGGQARPDDFTERHLMVRVDCVVVWSRSGLALGVKAHATSFRNRVQASMADFATVVRETRRAVARDATDRGAFEEAIQDGHRLLRQVSRLRLEAALPDGFALRRLMEASRFEDVLQTLHALNQEAHSDLEQQQRDRLAEAEKRRDETLQEILAVGSILGLFLAWLQVEGIKLLPVADPSPPHWRLSVAIGFGASVVLIALYVGRRRSGRSERRSVRH